MRGRVAQIAGEGRLLAGRRVSTRALADAGTLELTEENVELVLDEVRPYLMAGRHFV